MMRKMERRVVAWFGVPVLAALVWACGDTRENTRGSKAVEAEAKKVQPNVTAAALTPDAGKASPGQEKATEKGTTPPEPTEEDTQQDPLAYRDHSLFPTSAMSVYLLLKFSGDSSASYLRIRQSLRGDLKGIRFSHIKAFLERSGIRSEARKESLARVLKAGNPAILLTQTRETRTDPSAGQCVVCLGREKGGVRIIDPMVGNLVVSEEVLGQRYIGANLRIEGDLDRPAKNAPDLFCREIIKSFGEVPSGAKVDHNFPIQNAGSRPLTISRVETTCGCAAAMISKKGKLSEERIKAIKPGEKNDPKKLIVQKDSGGVIQPGQTAWISAHVNTLHKQGYMAFRIRVRSDDPEESELSVSLQGTVVRVFEYDPITLFFREVQSTEGIASHLWVRHYKSKPFKISGIRTTTKHIAARLDPEAPRNPMPVEEKFRIRGVLPKGHPEDQGWVGLKVEILPGAPIGTFSGTVSLKADETPIEINVAALIKGNIKVTPGYFSFGHIKKGEPRKVLVSISSKLGKAFKVDRVEVNKDFMVAKVIPGGNGHYQVKLSLKEGWSKHDIQGVVTIHSNDALEPRKKVLVYGFIKRE